MTAPQSIHDVLQGPHTRREIRRGSVTVHEVEPLRPVLVPSSNLIDWNARAIAFEEARRG